MSANALSIEDGGSFQKCLPNIYTIANRSTKVEFTTVSPTIAKSRVVGSFSYWKLNDLTFSERFWKSSFDLLVSVPPTILNAKNWGVIFVSLS